MLGIFLVPVAAGMLVIAYVSARKAEFRRRVMEMGYDPEAWEAPLRHYANICAAIALGIMISTACVIASILGAK